VVSAVVLPLVLSSCRGSAKEAAAVAEKAGVVSKVVQVTKQAEVADPLMGDWQGSWVLSDGSQTGWLVAQVIALGKDRYQATLLEEFDPPRLLGEPAISVLEDELRDGKVRFAGPARYQDFALKVEMTLEPGKFTGKFEGKGADGEDVSGTFKMEKTERTQN